MPVNHGQSLVSHCCGRCRWSLSTMQDADCGSLNSLWEVSLKTRIFWKLLPEPLKKLWPYFWCFCVFHWANHKWILSYCHWIHCSRPTIMLNAFPTSSICKACIFECSETCTVRYSLHLFYWCIATVLTVSTVGALWSRQKCSLSLSWVTHVFSAGSRGHIKKPLIKTLFSSATSGKKKKNSR